MSISNAKLQVVEMYSRKLKSIYLSSPHFQSNTNKIAHSSKEKFVSPFDKIHLISGAIAGGVSKTITAPLERTKILFQVQNNKQKNSINSVFKTIANLYRNEGYKGLFRGNTINIMKASPDTMIKFFIFEKLKFHFEKLNLTQSGHIKTPYLLFASGFAGSFANIIIFPMDVIKTHMCVINEGKKTKIKYIILDIYQKEGFFGFFRGLSVSSMTVFPAASINMTIYELNKSFYMRVKEVKQIPAHIFMLCGAISSTISCTLLYPGQLLQSKVIMNSYIKQRYSRSKASVIVNQIYKNEGFKGFYKGYSAAIIRIILGNATTFTIYEKCKEFFKSKKFFN